MILLIISGIDGLICTKRDASGHEFHFVNILISKLGGSEIVENEDDPNRKYNRANTTLGVAVIT